MGQGPGSAATSSPGLARGLEAGNWRPSGSAIVHEPRARRVPPKSKSAPGLPSGHWQRELQAARFRRGGIVGAQVRGAAARIGAFCHLKARQRRGFEGDRRGTSRTRPAYAGYLAGSLHRWGGPRAATVAAAALLLWLRRLDSSRQLQRLRGADLRLELVKALTPLLFGRVELRRQPLDGRRETRLR